MFVFEKLSDQQIFDFIKKQFLLILKKHPNITITDEDLFLVAKLGNGDLRNALNTLESAIFLAKDGVLTQELILQA